MVEILREQVAAASRILANDENAYALGTVSAVDRKKGVMVFSPVGITGISLCPESTLIVSLKDGSIIDGFGELHSDYLLHIAAYNAVAEMSALCHVHSEFVSVCANLGNPISVQSRFHAEHFFGQINCAHFSAMQSDDSAKLSFYADEIVAALEERSMKKGALLVHQDGALVWHDTPMKALDYAKCLEKCLRLHYLTTKSTPSLISSNVILQNLKDEFSIKHGAPTFYDDGSVKPRKSGCTLTDQERKYVMLFLLKYFDTFCRKNDIKYSLTGGTLLGAIRHGGFIPWDDDVDVFLTRPEYEKLIQLFKDDDRYVLMCRKKNPEFNYAYARLLDTKTSIIASPNTTAVGQGVFLDIFIVDGLPDNAFLQAIHMKYLHILYKCRLASHYNIHSQDAGIFAPLKSSIMKIINLTTNIHFWNRLLEHSAKRYPFSKGKFVGNFNSRYGEKEKVHRKVFESYINVPFEDGIFMVCAGYQEYLRNVYGDYLSLPAVEDRVGLHAGIVIWM